jgi:plasmid stability protein
MAVNLSIKAVPDALVEKLRKRAERNHRSLQGELITILEETLERPRSLSMDDTIRKLRQVEMTTASDSTRAIREDRDRR